MDSNLGLCFIICKFPFMVFVWKKFLEDKMTTRKTDRSSAIHFETCTAEAATSSCTSERTNAEDSALNAVNLWKLLAT